MCIGSNHPEGEELRLPGRLHQIALIWRRPKNTWQWSLCLDAWDWAIIGLISCLIDLPCDSGRFRLRSRWIGLLSKSAHGADYNTKQDPRASRKQYFARAPGCGKTTILCKWMAHQVFIINSHQIWRLDGDQVNNTESLSLYGEMLGAPVSRFPTTTNLGTDESPILMILGSVLKILSNDAIQNQVEELPDHDRFLVLNACYATQMLEDQVKAFMPMNPKGIILTHLDEERSWGRLTNLLLSTNCPICLLSGGQKIPGMFETFRPTRFLTNVFPSYSSLGIWRTRFWICKSYAQ